jgi:hypothetical protein
MYRKLCKIVNGWILDCIEASETYYILYLDMLFMYYIDCAIAFLMTSFSCLGRWAGHWKTQKQEACDCICQFPRRKYIVGLRSDVFMYNTSLKISSIFWGTKSDTSLVHVISKHIAFVCESATLCWLLYFDSEAIKNGSNIAPFNCDRKDVFLKKGRSKWSLTLKKPFIISLQSIFLLCCSLLIFECFTF